MAWRQRVRGLAIALSVVAAQAAAIGVYRWVESERPAPNGLGSGYERLSARPAPDVLLVGADGSSQRLGALRGTPVLLHFWATWCPPCKEELPALLEFGRELADKGGPRVIALSVDGDWEAVRRFFGAEVPAEVMMDVEGTAVGKYGVSTLPDTYLLSAEGLLRARFAGARDWRGQRLRDALRAEGGSP